MNKLPGKYWLLIAATHTLFFAAGYYVSSARNQAESGERVMSNFMDELAALAYLEKQDVNGTRNMIRIAIEGNLLFMSRYGTSAYDAYNASRKPNPKDQLLVQYDTIRKKYPPIDYSDGGLINRNIDEILGAAQASLEKQTADDRPEQRRH
jgi:hypothetical protein